MTPTLTQIQPCWVTSSQVAFSTMVAAASQPVVRVRAEVAAPGSHCHTVYAARPA